MGHTEGKARQAAADLKPVAPRKQKLKSFQPRVCWRALGDRSLWGFAGEATSGLGDRRLEAPDLGTKLGGWGKVSSGDVESKQVPRS